MRSGTSRLRGIGCAVWAWVGLALAAPAAPDALPPDEGGSWTNVAGHALKAEPVAIQGQTVTFKRADTGTTVDYPLAVFPPPEQERLRVALQDTTVPAGLQTAYEFSARILKRSRLLLENGEVSPEENQTSQAAALAAFRAQAAPLVEQQKLSPERLELIIRRLAAAE